MAGKRRGHGDGAIYRDDTNGVWVGAVDLGRDGTGRRRRAKVNGRTRAEARAKLAELRRHHDAGLPVPDRRLTVATLAEQWLARGLPSDLSAPTRDNYRWAVDAHLLPALGHRRVAELEVEHVEALLDTMAAAGLSRRTMALVRGVLVRVLRFAVRRGQVARNVAEVAEVPDGPRRDRWSLTVEQAWALLAAAEGDRLEALFVTGLLTGLRPGELTGLSWDAVDLDRGELVVRQALRRTRDGLALVSPKTRTSVRRLELPAVVVEALRGHRRRQAAERLVAGALWSGSADLVFVTEIGTPIDPSNLRRRTAALARSAGVGHVHPHLLRHCAASLLSAAGVPLEEVADVLGHRSVTVTAGTYRHPNPTGGRRRQGADGGHVRRRQVSRHARTPGTARRRSRPVI